MVPLVTFVKAHLIQTRSCGRVTAGRLALGRYPPPLYQVILASFNFFTSGKLFGKEKGNKSLSHGLEQLHSATPSFLFNRHISLTVTPSKRIRLPAIQFFKLQILQLRRSLI